MKKDVKVKKKKNRDSGFNIVYRIITALIAACTFPIMFFSSLFYLAYTVPLMSLISKNEGDTGASYFDASIYKILTEYTKYFPKGKVDLSGIFDQLRKPLVTIIVLYAAVCILALVIICLAAFTRKKLPIVIASGLGTGVLIALPFAYKALEKPLTDGTVSLDSFLHLGLASLSQLIITVDFLRVGNAYTLLWVVFAAILVWTGAVALVSLGDEKPKKEKSKKAE